MTHQYSRRSMIQAGFGGLIASLGAGLLTPHQSQAADPPPAKGKAKSVILLWMNGGPSHIDTFDPKPGTKVGGPFKAIKTKTPGLQLSEHLPKLAAISNQYTVIRSLTSKEGNHQRARYLLHTGYAPNPTIIHPTFGSHVASELGGSSDLPAFVSIGGPSESAGFLGAEYGGFVVNNASQLPANVTLARFVDDARFDRRRKLLEGLEDDFLKETSDSKINAKKAIAERSTKLIRSPNLKAFDLSEEPAATTKGYGDTDFGRGCLMARRLVEAGVKFVEVHLDGWDTHQDNFERVKKLSTTVDDAFSALINDLAARKLLDSTLVIWMGDFGRTPYINGNDGRDHWPGASSAVVAGGGTKAGRVYGTTDQEGAKVAEKNVLVPNLFATFATCLGVDPAKMYNTSVGRPIGLTDQGFAIQELLA